MPTKGSLSLSLSGVGLCRGGGVGEGGRGAGRVWGVDWVGDGIRWDAIGYPIPSPTPPLPIPPHPTPPPTFHCPSFPIHSICPVPASRRSWFFAEGACFFVGDASGHLTITTSPPLPPHATHCLCLGFGLKRARCSARSAAVGAGSVSSSSFATGGQTRTQSVRHAASLGEAPPADNDPARGLLGSVPASAPRLSPHVPPPPVAAQVSAAASFANGSSDSSRRLVEYNFHRLLTLCSRMIHSCLD